jgi:mannose/fructose/N-acetylgalactosamine-specific phosphotransferase system component IIB
MIKLLRVDDRLIHGAVGFSWAKTLNIDTILLLNDKIAKDEFQKMTLDIAKPRGTKLICESIEKGIETAKTHLTNKNSTMIIVNNVADADRILRGVPEIKSLNLGGLKKNEKTVKNIMDAIAVSQEDIDLCNGLVADGFEVEMRLIPDGKKLYFKDQKLS